MFLGVYHFNLVILYDESFTHYLKMSHSFWWQQATELHDMVCLLPQFSHTNPNDPCADWKDFKHAYRYWFRLWVPSGWKIQVPFLVVQNSDLQWYKPLKTNTLKQIQENSLESWKSNSFRDIILFEEMRWSKWNSARTISSLLPVTWSARNRDRVCLLFIPGGRWG